MCFQFPVGRRVALLQFLAAAESYGHAVRILEGLYRRSALPRLEDVPAIATQFITFFPLTFAVKRGDVTALGCAELPAALGKLPTFRNAVTLDAERCPPKAWELWDGKRRWTVNRLSKAERSRFPPLMVVNDTALRDLIKMRWRHEMAR